jgi:glycosyltransferase involved in cell wall biosynthesis
LRVALVINTYEGGAESGGFVHIFQAAKRWRGVEIAAFGPPSARDRVARELPGAEFVAVPSREGGNRAIDYAFRTIAAGVTLPARLRRYDAIYVLSQSLPDILPAVLARPRRVVAQVFHLQPLPWKRAGSLLNNLFAYASEIVGVWLVRRFVRTVVVLTPLLEPHLRLPRKTKIVCVGSGSWTIDASGAMLSPSRRSGVAYVGRLHPAKGLDDIIEAWKIVHDAIPDAVLTLVGSGDPSYVEALRAYLQRYGLAESVRLTGFVSEAEKARILGAARVFVSASREEGWGISVAEALALGVPAVTYDLPVFKEVFHRGTIAVPAGDIGSLARAISAIVSDDALHARLSVEARELAGAFSWDSVARAEEDAIRGAASS